MSRFSLKLPDLGEGTVQAEIVSWHVKPGDEVAEDDVLVEVMTDKAAVEIPSPVSGKVVSINGEPGERVPVGSVLVEFETATAEGAAPAATHTAVPAPEAPRATAPAAFEPSAPQKVAPAPAATGSAPQGRRVLTSPAIRRRAQEGGVDLRQVHGSGPNGRIVSRDLDAYLSQSKSTASGGLRTGRAAVHPLPAGRTPSAAQNGQVQGETRGEVREIKVAGVRRLIAERMSESAHSIPHFSYVEELDVTALEQLRVHLNHGHPGASLSYLPFLALALVRVLQRFPQCNAHYDASRGVVLEHTAVHLGIATQTDEGLKVPVVHDAQRLDLWEMAQEIRRVTAAARAGTATRAELTGSTITVTSLGKLGGIASTPIINVPEVAIIGINRAVERPVVSGGSIIVRRMMNLSSSFDHRFVDGYDAAAMIQALKEFLEEPATIFINLPAA